MTENKDMKHTLFKKQDLILIAVVLAAAALLFLGTKETSSRHSISQKIRNSRSMVHPAAQTI